MNNIFLQTIKKTKYIFLIALVGIVVNITCRQKEASRYKEACESLGFVEHNQQQALLNVFRIAGYLEPKMLWSAVYRSQIFENPEEVFLDIITVLNENGLEIEKVCKKLFSDKKYATKDVAQLILYLAQTAFDRRSGQERCELNSKEWMTNRKDEYIAQAELLGLIEGKIPELNKNYDAALVLGASRPGLYPRLIELNYYLNQGLKVDQVFVLAGQRELWAEIDGLAKESLQIFKEAQELGVSMEEIKGKIEVISSKEKATEGREYMLRLAQKSYVSYDTLDPFEQRNKRSYLKVVDPNVTITETTMSIDLLSQFPLIETHIVDTENATTGDRPDTVSTAKDTAHQFIQNIVDTKTEKKQFDVLSVSNNPYITRQAIAVQREFNKALKEFGLDDVTITVHGVGFSSKLSVAVIHSEVGALISELFKDAFPNVDTSNLTFRSRDNDMVVPEMPKA